MKFFLKVIASVLINYGGTSLLFYDKEFYNLTTWSVGEYLWMYIGGFVIYLTMFSGLKFPNQALKDLVELGEDPPKDGTETSIETKVGKESKDGKAK